VIDVEYLASKSLKYKQDVMRMAYKRESGHLSTAFSQMDILVTLYHGGILKYDPKNPRWADRDRFIMSKGQGGIGIYPILADLGFFPKAELDRFAAPGGILGVHCEDNIPGIEMLTGSLGHGLGLALGKARALRDDGNDAMVVVLTGDGELCEGSNWEAMLNIAHQQLGHVVVIVDHNGGATIGHLDEIKGSNDGPRLGDLEDKFGAFGFSAISCDGHNFVGLDDAFYYIRDRKRALEGAPIAIICETVKGKGARCFESGEIFPNHYFLPHGKPLLEMLKELNMDADEFKAAVAHEGANLGY